MQIIKKIIIILLISIAIIISYQNISQAAALPEKTSDIYDWIRNDAKKYINMDPIAFLNKYGKGTPLTYKFDVLDNNYQDIWKCIESFADGGSYDWYIRNVIDIETDRSVTVYYMNNKKATAHQVTKSSDKRKFNNLAYLCSNYASNINVDYIENYFHYIRGIFSRNHINFTGNEHDAGDLLNIDSKSMNAGDYKVRILLIHVPGGQNRLIIGKAKDNSKIKIVKKDSQSGDLLSGAKYRIYDSKGSAIQTGTTNEKGEFITTKPLKIGEEYTIEEIAAPNKYLLNKNKRKVTAKSGIVTVTFKNHYAYGRIKVVKKDGNTNKPLKNAKFSIYNKKTGALVASGTTGSDGTWTSKELPVNVTYNVVETSPPPDYISNFKGKDVTLEAGGTKVVTVQVANNPKPVEVTAVLKLIKGTKVPLEGITFGVKDWVPDNPEYAKPQKYRNPPNRADYKKEEDYNKAKAEWDRWKLWYDDWKYHYDYYLKSQKEYVSTGKSDANGNVEFTFTVKEGGTYSIYEIEGDNPYFDIKEKKVYSGYRINDKITIDNERTYVDIEGTVFIDEIEGKACVTNNLYDEGEGVNDIKVYLKRNGKVVSQINSGHDSKGQSMSEGKYKFWGDKNNLKIETKHINEYVIEFEYNGMKFESIPTNISESNGSKAYDIQQDRTSLNERYGTIDQSSKTQGKVEYDTSSPYQSKIIYQPNNLKYNQYAQEKYNIKGSTQGVYNLSNNYNPANDSITNVNFGIREREQPDLALAEDINNVNITMPTVSGGNVTHIFGYNERFANDDNKIYAPEVKFNDTNRRATYTRALYSSDIAYGDSTRDPDNVGKQQLDVRAIYKIGIVNQSTTLISRINELKAYFGEQYSVISVGDYKEETGSVEQKYSYKSGNGYVTINPNLTINAQKVKYIYIEIQVKRDALMSLINGTKELTIEAYSEITSYSTMPSKSNDKDTYRAGVDVDSQPDSMKIGDFRTFEDDTDRAPGFRILLQEERKIEGTIFEDKTQLTDTRERLGDGIFQEGAENGIDGIVVKLLQENGQPVKMYNGSKFVDAQTVTKNGGKYKLEGFIPGDYKLQYVWGSNTGDENENRYMVQKYKSTIVDERTYKDKLNTMYWYNNKFKLAHIGTEYDDVSKKEIRASDALDDPIQREKIDKDSEILKNSKIEEIKKYPEQQNQLSKMQSYTPKFRVNYEYSEYENSKTNFGDKEYANGGKLVNGRIQKNESFGNKIINVDLGLAKRPEQDLELNKRVKKVSLTLQNGQKLIDAEVIEENGVYKLKDNTQDTVYIPASNAANGMVKIETNNEISQSANLSVTYEFVIKNIGEIDYLTQDYYDFAKLPSTEAQREEKVVKLKPDAIIDYMDNAKIVLQSKEWKLLEETKQLFEDGLINEEIKESVNKVPKIMKIENIMEGENAYLSPAGMKNSNKTSVEMIVSKLIAPNEEFELGNQAEIIRTIKTGGAILESTHGNYDPVKTPNVGEADDSTAEDVTIIPPTGEDRNYIVPIVIGTSMMLILGVGVVIIKKFVLK